MGLLPTLNTPGLKFTEPGTTYTGKLLEIGEEQQARKYSPDGDGGPDYWDEEKTRPKMQRRFLLQCEPDPTVAGDNGERAIYAIISGKPGGMYAALNKALENATAVGGQLTVTFTGTDPESKNPQNPRKLYTASYVEPTLGAQMAASNSTPPTAPAAPAAGGELVKPDNFPQAAWDGLTDEAKKAVLAQQ